MSSAYVYRKPVARPRYAKFWRRLVFLILLMVVAGGLYFILTKHSAKPHSTTPTVEGLQTAGPKATFTNNFFQFEDTGNWVIDNADSTSSKFIYLKTSKGAPQSQLTVYVNQTPTSLSIAAQRVLPVQIVNNSFSATAISSSCASQYTKGELPKIKEVSIDGATMLCDPDASQYTVILSEINGDYQLHLKRPTGQSVQFIIVYKGLSQTPQPDSLLNIARSFTAR